MNSMLDLTKNRYSSQYRIDNDFREEIAEDKKKLRKLEQDIDNLPYGIIMWGGFGEKDYQVISRDAKLKDKIMQTFSKYGGRLKSEKIESNGEIKYIFTLPFKSNW